MGPSIDPEKLKSTFHSIVWERYKVIEQLEAIEAGLQHIRDGNSLTYKDLEFIANDEYWPFSKFWMWPHKEQIEDKLEETYELFIKLPKYENEVIDTLNNIFKNISLVSIVLRFVCPRDYAIYSRPPLRIMSVERGATDTEEYLNYINDLRLLSESLGVTKLSDTDMIVWAIAHRPELLSEFNKIIAVYLPKNISARILVECLQDDPLKIAKAFNRQGAFQTAGFWAAKAFEKFLDEECRKYPDKIYFIPKTRHEKIETLIGRVSNWRDEYNADLLRSTKTKCRNKIIPGINKFTQDDVNLFIKNLIKLKQISR